MSEQHDGKEGGGWQKLRPLWGKGNTHSVVHLLFPNSLLILFLVCCVMDVELLTVGSIFSSSDHVHVSPCAEKLAPPCRLRWQLWSNAFSKTVGHLVIFKNANTWRTPEAPEARLGTGLAQRLSDPRLCFGSCMIAIRAWTLASTWNLPETDSLETRAISSSTSSQMMKRN